MTQVPSDLEARFVRLRQPIPTIILRPGKTSRSKDIVVPGRILGTMFARGRVHHYRVEGADKVVYLCPPEWLPPEPVDGPRLDALLAKAEALLRSLGGKVPTREEAPT